MTSYQSPPAAFSFEQALAPFVQADGLPFAEILSAQQVEQIFADHNIHFGHKANAVWTAPLTLWTFVWQMLGSNRSCRAAVAKAATWLALARGPIELDTAGYCRARAKIPALVLEQLTLTVGDELERQCPENWLWRGRHVLLVDGTTLTAPDTSENQQAYPQPRTQKPGLGSPILRLVLLLSLATAACQGMAKGPYKGKEQGETALFRQLLERLQPGTIVLADRYYCSYFMVALLQARGLDVVFRMHQKRKYDFRRGRRLGSGDHVTLWHKPARPTWMDKETYASVPETLAVREACSEIKRPGYRLKKLVVVTTLLDEQTYAANDLLDLYHERWHVELDIRSLKVTMGMETLHCKTPFMIEKELWAHLLTYNLVRKVAVQAALEHGRPARQVSFAATQQAVDGAWDGLTHGTPEQRLRLGRQVLHGLRKEKAGHRPGRCEPRAVKRRPKPTKLLTKPRAEARAKLLKKAG